MEWKDRVVEMQLEDYATGWWDAVSGHSHNGRPFDHHYSDGYSHGIRYLDTNPKISACFAATPLK